MALGVRVFGEDLSSSAQNTHKKMGMVVQVPVTLILRVGGWKQETCCGLYQVQ